MASVNVYHSSGSDSDSYGSDTSSEGSLENTTPDCTAALKKHGSEAIADIMSKILAKNVAQPSAPILAKASTDRLLHNKRATTKSDDENDIITVKQDSATDVKVKKQPENKEKTTSERSEPATKKRRLWENMARVKPNALNIEKEKPLQRIATRGVVQLFNAVKKQQKLVEEKLQEAGGSINRREKAMKTVTKGNFLDVLKGTSTSQTAQATGQRSLPGNTIKNESEQDKPAWNILREDFMMGATMKDWDKASDEEETHNHDSGADMDMDDSDLDT